MGGHHLTNAGALIVQVLFGLAIGLFIFRFLMQGLRADFRNPLAQFVYKATNPLLMPVQKLLPVVRGWNPAALLFAYLLCVLEVWLLYRLAGFSLGLPSTLVVGLAQLIDHAMTSLTILIIVRAILSFVATDRHHPAVQMLYRLTDPILKPFQRIIPLLGGFDISPVFAILVLQLVRILIAAPLMEAGLGLVGLS